MTKLTATRPATGREEFARGWPVILGSLVCYAVSVISFPVYTAGVFFTELGDAFQVTRGQLSLTYLLFILVLAPMSPVIGLIADRVGIRAPVAVAVFGMAAVYGLMGTVMHDLDTYIMLMMLSALVGAGTLPVIFTRAINSWFDRARGLALGFCLVGTGVTATFAPALLASVIVDHGWQRGYLAIATVILVSAPLIIWCIKLAPWEVASVRGAPSSASGVTVGEALRGRVFWTMAAAFLLQGALIYGFVQHFVPMLTDAGMGKVEAAQVVGISGVAILIGRFASGALLDHVFAPWVAVACSVICVGGILALALIGVEAAAVGAFCLGLLMGAEIDLIGFMASRYFGLKAYGRLYGLLYGIFLLGCGFAPYWVGWTFDIFHNYKPALLIAAGLMIPAIVMFLTLPRYAEHEPAQEQGAT